MIRTDNRINQAPPVQPPSTPDNTPDKDPGSSPKGYDQTDKPGGPSGFNDNNLNSSDSSSTQDIANNLQTALDALDGAQEGTLGEEEKDLLEELLQMLMEMLMGYKPEEGAPGSEGEDPLDKFRDLADDLDDGGQHKLAGYVRDAVSKLEESGAGKKAA